MAYVLMLETLERLALAAIQARLTARALGSDVEVPEWFTVRADFDTALAAEPERIDPDREAMLEAVGLRGA